MKNRKTYAFTLVELLVVIAIIALLLTILLPTLSRARAQAKGAVCLTRLRTLSQGLSIYTNQHREVLPPSRMPDMGDGVNWQIDIEGGLKYRPTFLAIMGSAIGVQPFRNPMATAAEIDQDGEAGDRQNYASDAYVCPAVPDWTDERNGGYGYNYQFLGNSRLRDPSNAFSFKNWPVRLSQVKKPGSLVVIADCMGTAASYEARIDYGNNSRDAARFGNEGFNLDPPRVDPTNGEMANFDSPQARTAAHDRHLGKAAVLWLGGRAETRSLESLGYMYEEEADIIGFEGDNTLFNIDAHDKAWTR